MIVPAPNASEEIKLQSKTANIFLKNVWKDGSINNVW